MSKKQIGSTPLMILAIIAFVAVASYFLITKSNMFTTAPIKQYSAIQSDTDLSKASKDLDAADTNQINTELNQLNSEASAF